MKKILRLAQRTNFCRQSLVRLPQASFHGPTISAASKKLAQSLGQELKYEMENQQIDETVEDFLRESGFKMSQNDVNIYLSKTMEGTHVSVEFKAREPEEVPEGAEEEGFEQPTMVDFKILITNQAQNTLAFECASIDGELTIQNAVFHQDVGFLKTEPEKIATIVYQGPFFGDLEERLQTNVVDYLTELGIDEDLFVFMEHFSMERDQQLYVQWLEKFKEFAS